MSADIETNGKTRPALYVPQGRPTVRTKNPLRPDWLDAIKRPLLIVAANARQFELFRHVWRFDFTEIKHVLLTNDLRGVSFAHVLLVLPGSRVDDSIPDFCPLLSWEQRGGVTIEIPDTALHQPFQFTIEENMAAATRVAIAQHRHLDSLNRK